MKTLIILIISAVLIINILAVVKLYKEEKKHPRSLSTIWLLIIAFIPLFGPIFYYFSHKKKNKKKSLMNI